MENTLIGKIIRKRQRRFREGDIDPYILCKVRSVDRIFPQMIGRISGVVIQGRILSTLHFHCISLSDGDGNTEASVFRNVDLNGISHVLSIHRISDIGFCSGSGCNSKSHLIRLFVIKADRSSASFLKASDHAVADFCTVIDRVSDPGNDLNFLLLAILFPMHNGLLKGVVYQIFRQTCII